MRFFQHKGKNLRCYSNLIMRRPIGALITILVLYIFCIPGHLCAATLEISWNHNTESDLKGYRVYYGILPGSYQCALDVGNTNHVIIGGFLEEQVYYIAVTAYDYAGNESSFSREVCVPIPLNRGGGVLTPLMDRLFGIIGQAGSNQGISQYDILDFSAASPADIAGSVVTVRLGTLTSSGPGSDYDAGMDDPAGYEIRDVIAEVGRQVDLFSLYPRGIYYFLPLTENTAVIENGYLSCQETGVYLYLVTDDSGDLVHLLRVSAFDVLTLSSEYVDDGSLLFEDPELGITLELSSHATEKGFPIGIGRSTTGTSGSGFVFIDTTHLVEFAIAPFGLVLSAPAEVRVLYDGPGDAVVEYFDEGGKQWVPVEDARVEDGMVVFSAQSLGRFKVYPESDAALEGDSSLSSSGGCFISVCAP